MSVHILHHGCCFDGAASAALFAAFARSKLGASSQLRFIPKHHRRGNPFEPQDFECDWAACVDFRYSQDPALRWYFDHHRSAFSGPGDEAHFLADQSGQKFHDPSASSCALMFARLAHEHFGFDPTPHQELIEWADLIDAARFPSPNSAIELNSPAMKLSAFIQAEASHDKIEQFIEDLARMPLQDLANAHYLQATLKTCATTHKENLEDVAANLSLREDIVVYDLLDRPARVLNHFIPYSYHPDKHYALGAYVHRDSSIRIHVGFNPWLAPEHRRHNLALLCEPYGGGGHPYVAGCSFTNHEKDAARAALAGIGQALQQAPGSTAIRG